jgi:MYXO-CTERM domain-containing protein
MVGRGFFLKHLISHRIVAVTALLLGACGGGGKAGAQTTVTTHPRLLLTPSMVDGFKARASDPDVMAVIKQADGFVSSGVSYGYEGGGYSDAAAPLGFAYLVTGDKKYAAPLLAMLDAMNTKAASGDVSDISVDSTYASRSTGYALGIAFDWIYPELGDARKAATVKTANAYFDWYLNGNNVYDRDGPAESNYFIGHVVGYGAMGYATDGDNPRAAEIIAKIRSEYDANIPDAFTTGPSWGGFPVEGYVYGANSFSRMFYFLRMVETATGEKLGDSPKWANDIVLTFIESLKPNLWQQSDEGEYTGDTTGFLEPNQLQVFTSLAGDATTRGYGNWLIANHKTAPMGTSPTLKSLTKLLFPVTDAAVDYRSVLPSYRRAQGAAMMFMRSSWDDAAVWASFTADFTRWTGHTGRQTGHFTIQRGADYLLINGDQWKQTKTLSGSTVTGYSGPGYVGNTFVGPASGWTNTLFADDGSGGYLLDGDTYYGGQGGFSSDQPYLVSQSNDSTYVKLDATRAYQDNHYPDGWANRAVTQFVRNYAFLTPGDVVVYDRVRVKATSVNYDLRFYFNSNGVPTISNGVATSTVGGSKLFMHTVLPTDVQMKLAWQQLESVNFVPRVELHPAAASTDFDALTVFTAASTDFPNPPATNVLHSDDQSMVGVQIQEAQRERVALFAAALTDRIAGAVSYTLTSTGARHDLYDMQPNAGYTVTASSSGGGVQISVMPGGSDIMSDAAGVLAFDVAGTTVTPVPQDPTPMTTEPPRPPPPPGVTGGGGGGAASGGCGCRLASGRPVGHVGMVGLLALMVLGMRRRRRAR